MYLRTNRRDWFKALDLMVSEIGGAKRLVDIGSGDGHSTRQLLSRLSPGFSCDLVEPDQRAIDACSYLNTIFPVTLHQTTLQDFIRKENHYDVAYAIHSNYHWGIDRLTGRHSDSHYRGCLDGLIAMAPKVLIMGAPSCSDYYKLGLHNPFSDIVFTERIEQYYQTKGFHAFRISSPMHFYVEDLFEDDFAAREMFKFINYVEKEPTLGQLADFLGRLAGLQVNGEINFADEIVVVNREG